MGHGRLSLLEEAAESSSSSSGSSDSGHHHLTNRCIHHDLANSTHNDLFGSVANKAANDRKEEEAVDGASRPHPNSSSSSINGDSNNNNSKYGDPTVREGGALHPTPRPQPAVHSKSERPNF